MAESGNPQRRWSTNLREPCKADDERKIVTNPVPTNEYAPSSVFVNLHALVTKHHDDPTTVGRYKIEPTKWLAEHREACGLPPAFSKSDLHRLLLKTRRTVPEFSVQVSDGTGAYLVAPFSLDAVLERMYSD